MSAEEWRPVPGLAGWYEVSDQGRVRSLDRTLHDVIGRTYRLAGRLLTPCPRRKDKGHLSVLLSRGGRVRNALVHRLVLEAFVGPCPPGMVACHQNDVATDNRLANLRWDTHKANVEDSKRNGGFRRVSQRRDACGRGHDLTLEGARYARNGRCVLCNRLRASKASAA